MPSETYTKTPSAALDTLLQARGLPTGGIKLDKISRLVMQDAYEEAARKETEANVRKALNGTQRINSALSGQNGAEMEGRRSRAKGGDAGGRAKRGKKTVEKEKGKRVLGSEEYVKMLMAIEAASMEETRNVEATPRIYVTMTPKGKANSTASRLSNMVRSAEKHECTFVVEEENKRLCRGWTVALSAVLVFFGILGLVLGTGQVVIWFMGW
jgi:hypothetical protein